MDWVQIGSKYKDIPLFVPYINRVIKLYEECPLRSQQTEDWIHLRVLVTLTTWACAEHDYYLRYILEPKHNTALILKWTYVLVDPDDHSQTDQFCISYREQTKPLEPEKTTFLDAYSSEESIHFRDSDQRWSPRSRTFLSFQPRVTREVIHHYQRRLAAVRVHVALPFELLALCQEYMDVFDYFEWINAFDLIFKNRDCALLVLEEIDQCTKRPTWFVLSPKLRKHIRYIHLKSILDATSPLVNTNRRDTQCFLGMMNAMDTDTLGEILDWVQTRKEIPAQQWIYMLFVEVGMPKEAPMSP
jgi:hypothetical protein